MTGIGLSKVLSNWKGINIGKKLFTTGIGENKKPIKKSQVYTRTGDSGTSSLYNGERRSKNSQVFYALGETDELNACIGIAREYCDKSNNGLNDILAEIQSRLFDLGAAIATPVNKSSESKLKYTEFSSVHTRQLETWIDVLDSELPPLQHFIIPSGGLSSTHLNLARAVCRRAERASILLVQEGQTDQEIGRYLNRLSDFLFVAGRYAAKQENHEEILWKKPVPLSPSIGEDLSKLDQN